MQSRGLIIVLIGAVLSTLFSFIYNYFNLFYSPRWWWSLTFFCLLFTIINLFYPHKNKPGSDNEAISGIVWLKLILLFAAVFLYSLVDKPGLSLFSAHFFTHYILFTAFEIRYLLRIQKKQTQ